MLEKIGAAIGERGRKWTSDAALPGGDFPATGFDAEVSKLKASHSFLDASLARRLIRLYGTRARALLGDARTIDDLGEEFGAGLHEAEVRYLCDREWARTAEDILWRRTKLGLHLSARQRDRLSAYLANLSGDRLKAAAE